MVYERFVADHMALVEDLVANIRPRYLKKVDSFQNNHVHCFLTGGNVKFMLLMNPDPNVTPYSAYQTSPPSRPNTARQNAIIANNPTSPQTEEAVRQFMFEVRFRLFWIEQLALTGLLLRSTKHG